MNDIYNDQTYLNENPLWHQEDSLFKAKYIYQMLSENKINYSSVCEIGCGTGEVLVQLQKLNGGKIISYTGFDISKDAIAMAQQKQVKGITFELKDITDKADKSAFDLILVIDVIEHLPDYFSFLKSISKKSKYTVFHIPLDLFVWSLFKEQMLIESKQRVGHIHNFTEDFILSVLKDNGFKILSKQITPPDFAAHSFKQRIVNGAKKLLYSVSPRFCSKTLGGCSVMVLCYNQ